MGSFDGNRRKKDRRIKDRRIEISGIYEDRRKINRRVEYRRKEDREKEDLRISNVFKLIHNLWAQINDNMWAGQKEGVLGYRKKTNLLKSEVKINKKNEIKILEEELNRLLIRHNRIEIRSTPKDIDDVAFLTKLREFYFSIDDVWNDYKKEIIEHHIIEGLVDRDIFIENYYSLDPPYVKSGTSIPYNINRLCQESRWCYVYERYNATIVLSRALIETILKNELGYEVNSFKYINDLIKDAKKKKIIKNKKFADGAHDIKEIANNILHQGNDAIDKKKGKCKLTEWGGKSTLDGSTECTLDEWTKCTLQEKAKCTLGFILDFLQEIYLNNPNINQRKKLLNVKDD